MNQPLIWNPVFKCFWPGERLTWGAAQVLERLGLDKKGRKADLQARVAAYFGEAANGVVQPPLEQYKIDAAGAACCKCVCRLERLGMHCLCASPSSCNTHC